MMPLVAVIAKGRMTPGFSAGLESPNTYVSGPFAAARNSRQKFCGF